MVDVMVVDMVCVRLLRVVVVLVVVLIRSLVAVHRLGLDTL